MIMMWCVYFNQQCSDGCYLCVCRGRFQTHWRDSLWKSLHPALKSARKFLENWRNV